MSMLSEPVRKKAAELLAMVANPVRIILFTQESDCRFCRDVVSLTQELGSLSDKLSVEVYDLQEDVAKATEYQPRRQGAGLCRGR
jgi:alkyl hydroperoxide reductase subunit AhpF